MVEAYPLHWPSDYPRSKRYKDSRFKTTVAKARNYIKDEVRRLGGKDVIISSNVPINKDGELRADYTRYKLDDPGIAVYFMYNGNQVCLCCDTYARTWENLHGIGRTIEALRQIDRDGVSDFLNRAFTGFKAIAERASGPSCWDVLNIEPTKNKAEIDKAYKQLVKDCHPDKQTGSLDKFHELQAAREAAHNYANGIGA